MDDDFIINWDLRGPKRMRKRKELNALIKNSNQKLKQTAIKSKNKATSFFKSLKNNDSSSNSDELYFAANKQIIRKRKRNKLLNAIKTLLYYLLVLIVIIMNVSLIYWNNDLKAELGSIRDQHITNFNSLKSSTNGLLNIIDNYKKKSIDTQSNNSNNFEYFIQTLSNQKELYEQITNLNKTMYYLLTNLNHSNYNFAQELNDTLKSQKIHLYENNLELYQLKNFVSNMTNKLIPQIQNDLKANADKIKFLVNNLKQNCNCNFE